MPYIFKQKVDLRELAGMETRAKRVLLYQPESYLADLYQHYLQFHNFDVKHCPNLEMLKAGLRAFTPQMLIFSLEGSTVAASLAHLLSVKKDFPNLVLLTTGFDTEAATLKKLLSLGISSHLDRRHSRPGDVAILAKTLLNH